jgi:hypothetical protein
MYNVQDCSVLYENAVRTVGILPTYSKPLDEYIISLREEAE